MTMDILIKVGQRSPCWALSGDAWAFFILTEVNSYNKVEHRDFGEG